MSTRSADEFSFWKAITPTLSYLSYANLNNTIGVVNNTLYDILPDNNGTGNVAVCAQSFNVSCGPVQNAAVIGTPTNESWNVNGQYSNNAFSFMILPMGKKFHCPCDARFMLFLQFHASWEIWESRSPWGQMVFR
jgi:hypothetical protein